MTREVIAIDLGATNLRVGIVDENLNIIKVLREKTTKYDSDLLYAQIKRMLKEVTKGKTNLKYVGVSACGLTSYNKIDFLPNLKISDFDLAKLIETDFPNYKVKIANDATCSGYMESLRGCAKDDKTSFFITISSGIGCGLVVNHELIDLPFECGHNYIGYNNRYYEFEQIASGNGLVFLSKINGLEVSGGADFFQLVRNKDIKALAIYDTWIQIVSSFIANVQLNYNPDCIILSGGVMKSRDLFDEDIESVANAFIAPYPVKKIQIKYALFDQDAGLMGATSLALGLLEKE